MLWCWKHCTCVAVKLADVRVIHFYDYLNAITVILLTHFYVAIPHDTSPTIHFCVYSLFLINNNIAGSNKIDATILGCPS